MILYRISHCKHSKDISGTGAKLFGGRWNSIGTAIHYMAASRALAALEVLVNINNLNNNLNFCLTSFELPEHIIQTVNIDELPVNWRNYPSGLVLQQIGDNFVKQNDKLLLKVPSAIIQDEFNYLMNVAHPLSTEIKIIDVKPFSFDTRLL